MSTEFRITEEDYVACGLLHGAMTPRSALLHGVFEALLIILGVIAWISGYLVSAVALIGAGVAGAVIPWLFKRTYFPWIMKRHFNRFPKIKKTHEISLANDGLRFTSGEDSGSLKWEEILRWREDQHFLLLYAAPRLYHLVPKRVAADGFPLDELISKLNEHVGRAT